MRIEISVEGGDWPAKTVLEELAVRALDAACRTLGLDCSASEVSLLFCDDARIRELNGEWRGKDASTNVLSFPAFDLTPDLLVSAPLPPVLGDIVLARETILHESELENRPVDHHLTHLIVHGFLHLLGHDHEDDDEAELMEGHERRILAGLAIADPYA